MSANPLAEAVENIQEEKALFIAQQMIEGGCTKRGDHFLRAAGA